MAFLFWECDNGRCGFRFPAADGQAPVDCPRCGAPIRQVASGVAGQTTAVAPDVSRAPLAALLDNIRSIHNVGSMFRAADGAAVTHLHLCGITATPQQPRLAKAALGAQKTVAWSYASNGVTAAAALRAQGYRLWALETTPMAEPLFASAPTHADEPLLLVVGNEKAGVDPGILTQCERVVCLPMGGAKQSLNAAVAFGIAVYWLRYVPA